jgi:putative phosphoesterase
MKIALIGDMHANLPALEAVLEHAHARGVEAIWNIGDFLGYGPFPNEVVKRLRHEDALSVVGNYDTDVLAGPDKRPPKNPAKAFAKRWACDHLSKATRKHLQSLPQERRLEVAGKRILLTHGSPASPDEHLLPDTPERRLRELADMAEGDVVICGHSHVPFVRKVGKTWFINTGSVGRPDDGDPRACYAILEITPRKFQVRHYRLDYNIQRTIDAMRKHHLPEAFLQMIVRGKGLDDVIQEASKQARIAGAPPAEQEDPRLGPILQLAALCKYEQGHTHQVTRLALRLFDQLKPLHELGDPERFLLHAGSLLHDIGFIEGQTAHHKTAQRIILDSPLLPFEARDRQVIACIARYHRRAEPKRKHEPYGSLSKQDRAIVKKLAAILRVADSFDIYHEDRVRNLSCQIRRRRVTIDCAATHALDEEREQALAKGRLFQKVFDRKLDIQWHPA